MFQSKVYKLVSINIIISLIILFILPPQTKIDLRWILFAKRIESKTPFLYPPKKLLDSLPDFLIYKKKYLKDIIDNYKISLLVSKKMDDSISTIKKAQAIGLLYSKNGGSGCGEKSDNLIENIKWLSQENGHGCCSDHAQTFLAISIINGVFSREVHHIGHTFNEFYDPYWKKWIWIDSQFCLMAQNNKGEYLSLYELNNIIEKKEKFRWVFFGTSKHKFYSILPSTDINFQVSNFQTMIMTLGNNVFEVDYYNQKLSWLSKEVRQIILIILKKQPKYLIYDPHNNFYKSINQSQNQIIAFCLFIIVLNIVLYRMINIKKRV
ncbi:hypothetical protein [Emticicia sp.]|uniref:hypothetical protein n=1 Tax=Emticicia sp. TaxID=1930953 RepID=UPI003752C6E6